MNRHAAFRDEPEHQRCSCCVVQTNLYKVDRTFLLETVKMPLKAFQTRHPTYRDTSTIPEDVCKGANSVLEPSRYKKI